jgi:hypothetical protein
MFEGDYADMCAGKFLLVLMGGSSFVHRPYQLYVYLTSHFIFWEIFLEKIKLPRSAQKLKVCQCGWVKVAWYNQILCNSQLEMRLGWAVTINE